MSSTKNKLDSPAASDAASGVLPPTSSDNPLPPRDPSPRLMVFLGILFSLLMVLNLLLSSIEITVYKDSNWFRKEYEKYSVLEDVRGEMSMDAALQVTDEMMEYLRGNRDDLVVMTTIDGKKQEFFSQREKDHLADCQVLFIRGFQIRNISIILMIVLAVWVFLRSRKNLRDGTIFTRTVPRGMGGITGMFLLIGIFVSRDFDKYFVIFHHIFFDNDLWLLDPKEDNLINLLPEGFFMDTATRIIWIYLGLSLCCIGLCYLLYRKLQGTK